MGYVSLPEGSSYPRFLPSDVRIAGVPIFEGRADFQLPGSKRSSLTTASVEAVCCKFSSTLLTLPPIIMV